jgi:hypothetical protein
MADPFDGPEIATLSVAVVGLIGTVIGAWFARQANSKAGATKEQVANDHKTNLRDNIDQIEAKIDTIGMAVTGLDRGQLHLIHDVGLLKSGWQMNRDDIDTLMDTADVRRQRDTSPWAETPPDSRRARRERNV